MKQQFKDKPNILAFLDALTGPIQDIEDAFYDLLTERGVDTAVGDQLDDLGTIVGQPRDGLSDDDYRPFLRARIATNRSNGTINDLIVISELILDDLLSPLTIEPQYPAGVVVNVDEELSEDLSDALIGFLRDAKSSGVRLILEYFTDEEPFTFAIATFLNGAASPAATSLTVDSTEGFTATGTLVIDKALGVEEEKAYTGITPTSFTGVTALSSAHVDNSCVYQKRTQDLGFNYVTVPGGGNFASAKE